MHHGLLNSPHTPQVEAYSITLGQDKSQLVAKITSLETERAALSTERAELRSDIERLKDDLDALSEERAGHEASITALNEKIVLLNVEKEKVSGMEGMSRDLHPETLKLSHHSFFQRS